MLYLNILMAAYPRIVLLDLFALKPIQNRCVVSDTPCLKDRTKVTRCDLLPPFPLAPTRTNQKIRLLLLIKPRVLIFTP